MLEVVGSKDCEGARSSGAGAPYPVSFVRVDGAHQREMIASRTTLRIPPRLPDLVCFLMPARLFNRVLPPQRIRTFLVLFALALTSPLVALGVFALDQWRP